MEAHLEEPVAELFVALTSKNVSLTSYMMALKSYVHDIVEKTIDAKKKKHDFGWIKWVAPTIHGCTLEKLVCVARHLPAVPFSFFAPQVNALEFVKCFRSRLQDDPL
ncbi:hypothetical protein AeMF1_007302 [Aphanomyces euteiches]|nr:hypothetical protein AeMF1_007302 [Aphanomyces euteiches]KAH9181925.1 hypothetical protein AeNC1_016099 [Aphanomyces euteiches]